MCIKTTTDNKDHKGFSTTNKKEESSKKNTKYFLTSKQNQPPFKSVCLSFVRNKKSMLMRCVLDGILQALHTVKNTLQGAWSCELLILNLCFWRRRSSYQAMAFYQENLLTFPVDLIRFGFKMKYLFVCFLLRTFLLRA